MWGSTLIFSNLKKNLAKYLSSQFNNGISTGNKVTTETCSLGDASKSERSWKYLIKKGIGLCSGRLIMEKIVRMFTYWVWSSFTFSALRMSWFCHKNSTDQTGLSVPWCSLPWWKTSRKFVVIWIVNLNHCLLAEIIATFESVFPYCSMLM